MSPCLTFMLDIIQKMGDFQHKYFRTEIDFETKSGAMDVVSFVDKECEQMFRAALTEKFPEDALMGEESYDPDHDYRQHNKLWIVDPLDGTLMYQRGIPTYGPMIAYVENGVVQCSAILLPELGELYHADESGSYRNGVKINVSTTQYLENGIIHGSCKQLRRKFQNDKKFIHYLDSIGKHLDVYSSAMSLSQCTTGGIDGDIFFPKTGRSWDSVPGGFLIQQAGGRVTNFGSDTWDIFDPKVIFSNGLIHGELQRLLES